MMRLLASMACLALLAACAALQPPPDEIRNTYVLEAPPTAGTPSAKRDLIIGVSMPRARPGFDTSRMAYERRPHEIEYFTRNRWIDSPARMLEPLVTQALKRSGTFRGAMQLPGAERVDRRLDIELVRLLQDFSTTPSRVRFTLHAQLVDTGTRRVVAAREFDEVEPAPSDDPYGGVVAANRALARLLGSLVQFCADQSPLP